MVDVKKLLNFVAIAGAAVLMYSLICLWIADGSTEGGISGLALLDSSKLSPNALTYFGVTTWQRYLPMIVCIIGITVLAGETVRLLRSSARLSFLLAVTDAILALTAAVLAVLFMAWNIYDVLDVSASAGPWMVLIFGLIMMAVCLLDAFGPRLEAGHPAIIETEAGRPAERQRTSQTSGQ